MSGIAALCNEFLNFELHLARVTFNANLLNNYRVLVTLQTSSQEYQEVATSGEITIRQQHDREPQMNYHREVIQR